MTAPLIDRLTTELGYPRLSTMAALEAAIASPNLMCLFMTGNPQKNLETNDVAVILPELQASFGRVFDCAVIDQLIEIEAKDRLGVRPTPSLIFACGGDVIGSVPRVRDWDDYQVRLRAILSGNNALAA